jgi:hypothetical protein
MPFLTAVYLKATIILVLRYVSALHLQVAGELVWHAAQMGLPVLEAEAQ